MTLIGKPLILTIVAVLLSATPALAQQYNDMSAHYAYDEAFRQQEELERYKIEQEKEREALRKETEALKSDIDKMEADQKLHNELQRSSLAKDEVAREMDRRLRDKQRQKDEAKEESYNEVVRRGNNTALSSSLSLNDSFYARSKMILLKNGFTLHESDIINGMHKDYIYRIERDALNGNPAAQFQLFSLYFTGHPYVKSLDADSYKRVQGIIKNKPVAMSPEEHRKAIIESIKATLGNGNDSVYEALTESFVIKHAGKSDIEEKRIVNRNHPKAAEWIELAAKGGNINAKALQDYVKEIAKETERVSLR